MMPFKKGAFHVAVDSGLPILPVVMSEYDFLDHKKKRFGKGVINIQVILGNKFARYCMLNCFVLRTWGRPLMTSRNF
jgi:hypothetical protein